jgi:predicted DNA-binding transcriptional regulator AlpA
MLANHPFVDARQAVEPSVDGLPRRLPISVAAQALCLSRTAVYRLVAAGVMPPLRQFAPRVSGFDHDEFVQWMRTRPIGVDSAQTDRATVASMASPRHRSKAPRKAQAPSESAS